MSDLQDNIDAYDRFIDFDATPTFDGDKALAIDWGMFVDAARRVANGDYRTATFEMLCQFFGFIDDDADDIETLAEIMAIWDERLAALGIDPPEND